MASLEERVAPFLTVRQVIVLPVSTLSSMFLVYGFYILLFGTTVRLLLRTATPNRKSYLGMTIALFSLATIHVFIQCWSAIRQSIINFTAAKTRDYTRLLEYNNGNGMKTAHFAILNIFPILLNLTAEAMMVDFLFSHVLISGGIAHIRPTKIHRCYTIWNFQKRVGIPLLGASIIMNAIGLSSAIMGTVAISDKSRPTSPELFKVGDELLSGWALASLSFNGFVTILTSGRIWHVSRDARKTMGEDVKRRYETVVAIILESGMLYPTVQLARTILNYTYTIGPIPIDIGPLSTQAAGIAPTLIIARAAGGRSFRSMYPTRTPSTVASRMQFADADGTRARIPRRSADLEVQLGARTSLSYSDASPDLESPSQRTGKGKEQATI